MYTHPNTKVHTLAQYTHTNTCVHLLTLAHMHKSLEATYVQPCTHTYAHSFSLSHTNLSGTHVMTHMGRRTLRHTFIPSESGVEGRRQEARLSPELLLGTYPRSERGAEGPAKPLVFLAGWAGNPDLSALPLVGPLLSGKQEGERGDQDRCSTHSWACQSLSWAPASQGAALEDTPLG